MSKVAFIQLARSGDVFLAAPMMRAKAQEGHSVHCYVHENFADALAGFSYVTPIVWHGLHRDLRRCVDDAKSRGFDEVIPTQLDGNELSRQTTARNFVERQWRLGGMWEQFNKLPLIVDRRDRAAEEKELEAYQFPFDSAKPILLYSLHGHSSPFYKWQPFERWLKSALSNEFTLFDIGKVTLSKPHHLLAFLERSEALVSAATLPVPLAYACGIPTICLCCDTDPNGETPRREFFWPEPRPHWLGRMSYGESLTPNGQSQIARWLDPIVSRGRVHGPPAEPPPKPAPLPVPRRTPFTENPQPDSEITLGVPPGVGDIVWVYQKFAPYFSRINFRILSQSDDAVQRRSVPWLKLLPKVGKVEFQQDHPMRVAQLIRRPCTMKEAFEQWRQAPNECVDYSCNLWLERGIRIEDIDPGARIEKDVELLDEPFCLPHERYAVLYVSGDSRHPHRLPTHVCWTVKQWARYVKMVWEKYDLHLPVIIIGAEFDQPVPNQLLDELHCQSSAWIGQEPGRVVHLLKHADLFLGYQSGLNVVADLAGVRAQQMLYFPYLAEWMSYSWCKPENIQTRFFADSFGRSPEQVAARHQLFTRELAVA